jgi:glycosyltransferase involved in cell wall biosynthesis
MRDGITVVIPVHPPRLHSTMHRAVESVWEQTLRPDAVSIAIDHGHEGAAVTRNKALAAVGTEWTAFLDSDDQLRPGHLQTLMDHADKTGADLVYPWFTIAPFGADPWPEREGQPFDRKILEHTNYIPVTVLARTALLQDVGGFQPLGPPENPCDDYGAWKALIAAGAKFSHVNVRTWIWWWGDNTNGRGDVW